MHLPKSNEGVRLHEMTRDFLHFLIVQGRLYPLNSETSKTVTTKRLAETRRIDVHLTLRFSKITYSRKQLIVIYFYLQVTYSGLAYSQFGLTL